MLEALPVEIIEQIFLKSLNLNFPRASRVLAAALSREHIYRLLIILAFWDDAPVENPGSVAIERVFAPLEYVPLELEERIALQKQIWHCRWLNLKRVKEQLPTIMLLTIHRQWINARMTMDPDQRAKLEHFMARKDDTLRTVHGRGRPLNTLKEHPMMRALAEAEGPQDFEMYLIPNILVAILPRTTEMLIATPTLQIPAFPSHLLRGRSTGFTKEDVLFLEMLRICSYNYKPDSGMTMPTATATVDRVALNEGVANAIRTQNLDALTTLLKIDEFIFRFDRSSFASTTFYTIPEEHFVNVTKYGRDNPARNIAFMHALIRASAESFPHTSSEISSWIIDMAEAVRKDRSMREGTEARFLRWLCDFPLRLPALIGFVTAGKAPQQFNCGALDRAGFEGHQYNEALKPAPQTLKNYMPESPFKAQDLWLKKFGSELPPHMLKERDQQ